MSAALPDGPAPEPAAALVAAAVREERAEEALGIVAAMEGRLPPSLFHQLMAKLLLETPAPEAAAPHLEALAAAGAPADLLTDMRVALALRQGDRAGAVAWLEAAEAGGGRPLAHFLRKWSLLEEIGRLDPVAREVEAMAAAIPADRRREHALLELHRCAVAHNRMRFAESAARLDRLLRACASGGIAPARSAPPPPARTAGRLRRVAADIAALAAAQGLEVAFTAGTLLGLVRDGAFLPGDKDLDLAVLGPAGTAPVAAALLASGLFQPEPTPFPFGSYRVLRHRPTGVVLDLIAHAPGDGVRLNRWEGPDGALLRQTVFPFYRATPADFPGPGLRLPVPDGVDAHLAALYGDWRTPDPAYDTTLSARNLTAHTPYLASYGRLKAATLLLGGLPDRAPALLRQLSAREPGNRDLAGIVRDLEGTR
ncbi:MAG TPA: hypothetical protein VEB20_11260 [Azospirillaceae bacterium]|nr:hypothetical protein [Azospirillaceae bacterium]